MAESKITETVESQNILDTKIIKRSEKNQKYFRKNYGFN